MTMAGVGCGRGGEPPRCKLFALHAKLSAGDGIWATSVERFADTDQHSPTSSGLGIIRSKAGSLLQIQRPSTSKYIL